MSLDVYLTAVRPKQVFSRNITHNLGRMAREAGLYEALWRPEEIGVETAAQLIPLLRDGLAKLEGAPDAFREFNPENGWGSHDGLVEFVSAYLTACLEDADAKVSVSR